MVRGKQKAVKAEEWNESMLRQSEPNGPYLTRAYAALSQGVEPGPGRCHHFGKSGQKKTCGSETH